MEKQNKKDEVLSDKAFSRLVLTSVVGILFCLVCLCSATYAWFSDSAPSAKNKIQMAESCLLTVTVLDDGTQLEDIENGVDLQAGKTYLVEMTLPKDSSSGYCLLRVGEKVYYTDYIAAHSDPEPHTTSFTIIVESDQTVVFETRWGIYSADSNIVDGKLILP